VYYYSTSSYKLRFNSSAATAQSSGPQASQMLGEYMAESRQTNSSSWHGRHLWLAISEQQQTDRVTDSRHLARHDRCTE
jgi:hypothetical protein